MYMVHLPYIIFVFALGACIGSFLNVVVWRLPRGESLATPPSHCPKCNRTLKWYDNIPIFGWIKLRGKCRFCGERISPRYPIVEAITAGLFVLFYVLFFIYGIGPCPPPARDAIGNLPHFANHLFITRDYPIFGLYLYVLSALLASSLIDLDSFTIIAKVFWWMAGVSAVFHAIVDKDTMPGSLSAIHSSAAALAAGGAVGFGVSLLLSERGWVPQSFPLGEPLMEIDREELEKEIKKAKREKREAPELPPEYTRMQIRLEIGKEMLFLMPPLLLGALWVVLTLPGQAGHDLWERLMHYTWLRGLLGSVLGALVGGFILWMTRILGTIGFGRVGMGLGDVDLMLGVGAALGAGRIAVAFFIAPFFGLAFAVYMLFTTKRREIPYGPYLSLGAAFAMLFYCPISDHLRPGFVAMVQHVMSGGN